MPPAGYLSGMTIAGILVVVLIVLLILWLV